MKSSRAPDAPAGVDIATDSPALTSQSCRDDRHGAPDSRPRNLSFEEGKSRGSCSKHLAVYLVSAVVYTIIEREGLRISLLTSDLSISRRRSQPC